MMYTQMPSLPPMPVGEQLPLERISPRPSLRPAEEAAPLEALAESIRRYGLMRPVIVRRTGLGRYVVVSGNRRLLACRMLGMSCIAVRILADDAHWQPADRLLEALLTRRMHYLEEAAAFQALHDTHGMPWEELAQALGAPEHSLRLQASLAELADELRALLLEEGAPMSIALLLSRLPQEEDRMRTAQRIVRERLCIRDAALLVGAELRRAKENRVPFREKDKNGVGFRENTENKAERRTNGGQRIIAVVRDRRLYINAIRDIAAQMQSAGVAASVTEQRRAGQVELVIRMQARMRRTERYQSM